MCAVKAIPEGCNSVNVYLVVKDAEKAMDFYAKAFDGVAGVCMRAPDGSIMHGEVKIGNSTVMITQENTEWQMISAETMGGSPASMHIYLENVDAAFQKALDAGCTEISPLMDAFWGDRYGKLVDPFGFQWGLATHIEDVPEDEMKRRGEEWFAQMGADCQE